MNRLYCPLVEIQGITPRSIAAVGASKLFGREIPAGSIRAIDHSSGDSRVDQRVATTVVDLSIRSEDRVAAGKAKSTGSFLANRYIAIRPGALETHIFHLEAEGGILSRLERSRKIDGSQIVVSKIDVSAVRLVHRVDAKGELVRELPIDVDHHPIGGIASVLGGNRTEIVETSPFGINCGQPSGRSVTKHQGVRSLVEVDALDVVVIRSRIP